MCGFFYNYYKKENRFIYLIIIQYCYAFIDGSNLFLFYNIGLYEDFNLLSFIIKITLQTV